MPDIIYRHVQSNDELRQAVALQHLVWGESAHAVIPLHMLHSMVAAGCPLIGAFDGNQLVGVSVAFFGMADKSTDRPAMANLKLASKRLAVHPDYRSEGIGFLLKKKQRQFAEYQGVHLITWTFDPLISRNAYVYLHKLGGMAKVYQADYFAGIDELQDQSGASDRMVCEWWIKSNRVEERLYGGRRDLALTQYLDGHATIVNPSDHDATIGLALPREGSVDLNQHHIVLVEIPTQIIAYEPYPDLYAEWRQHIRSILTQLTQSGYIATDFLHEMHDGRQRSFYVLSFDGV